jgi:signal transduction histidine kinase
LVTNAIKYSKEGSTTEVSCIESLEWIEVRVKDSGRGIPASAKKYLFERYRQLLPDDKQKGKGLGLSIAKTIIDAHDGLIGCESEPGLGSVFWFRLRRVGKA